MTADAQSKPEPAELETCFPFLTERGHVISLVGGGGKTTLMMTLAEKYCAKGMKTVVMTTTRIQRPLQAVSTLEACRARWEAGEYAVCGEDAPEGKLRAPKDEVLTALLEEADAVLIEADGAKRMPCKAPADHEPVILPQSDIVIGVVGAEVLFQPVERVCFRPEQVCSVLGCNKEDCLTENDLAKLLLSEKGTRKSVDDRIYYIAINKCDDEERLQNGIQIAHAIQTHRHEKVVLMKLK